MISPLCYMYSNLYFKDLESKATGRGKAIHFEFPCRGSATRSNQRDASSSFNPPFLNRFQPDVINALMSGFLRHHSCPITYQKDA